MMPIDFPGTNTDVVKPDSMTDEECCDLRAMQWFDNNGFKHWLMQVKPSKEDLDAMNRGEPINVHFMSNTFPVIGFFTRDEKGEINE